MCKSDFYHLMGLHKLLDYPDIKTQSREKIFNRILNGNLSYEFISKSIYFSKIQSRFEPFSDIQNLLDSNQLIFKYNTHTNRFSVIQAEYLLRTPYYINDKFENDIYIFLDKKPSEENYFCRSFFPKEQKDYTIGQANYTLLYKEKINTITQKSEIQYNKLYRFKTVSTEQMNLIQKSDIEIKHHGEDNNNIVIKYFIKNEKSINSLIS